MRCYFKRRESASCVTVFSHILFRLSIGYIRKGEFLVDKSRSPMPSHNPCIAHLETIPVNKGSIVPLERKMNSLNLCEVPLLVIVPPGNAEYTTKCGSLVAIARNIGVRDMKFQTGKRNPHTH